MGIVWVNGELVDEARAAVSVHDRGFLLGDGLFETMRAYGGRVFALREHLERLRRGAERIGLPLPDGLERAVCETVAANRLDDAAVRLTASRGAGDGLLPPEAPSPTVVVAARPYRPDPAWHERGIRAALARGRLDEHRATAGLKALGYLEAVVAVAEARAAGCDDALFLDTAGHLAEAAASNLFVVVDGELLTPPLSCGILPGVTRAAVLRLAARRGWTAHERALEPASLERATEAFLTSSLREIVPLVEVGGRVVGAGRPGPLAGALLSEYRDVAHGDSEEGGSDDR
ncbi:MAG TPA: aminotransferase class IV [Longimicrobiales bacterium]|nr:aminotransferase class IV [Longimicrobiales bacterium]